MDTTTDTPVWPAPDEVRLQGEALEAAWHRGVARLGELSSQLVLIRLEVDGKGWWAPDATPPNTEILRGDTCQGAWLEIPPNTRLRHPPGSEQQCVDPPPEEPPSSAA